MKKIAGALIIGCLLVAIPVLAIEVIIAPKTANIAPKKVATTTDKKPASIVDANVVQSLRMCGIQWSNMSSAIKRLYHLEPGTAMAISLFQDLDNDCYYKYYGPDHLPSGLQNPLATAGD